MPAPSLESFSAELYKHVAPMAWDDANQGYALAYFCKAIGQLFQVVEDLSRDQVLPGGKVAPGWSQALDAVRCPGYALPWLAQFVGATVDQRLSEANQRQQLEQVNNWRRGTLAAIQSAPMPYLTGTKSVVVRERFNGNTGLPDPYYFEVITLFSETPDAVPNGLGQWTSPSVLAALTAQKPAGLVMTYVALDGQDFQTVKTNFGTLQNVKDTYVTLAGLRAGVPGT